MTTSSTRVERRVRRRDDSPTRRRVSRRRRRCPVQVEADTPGLLVPTIAPPVGQRVALIVSLLAGLLARRVGHGATALVLGIVSLLASLQGLAPSPAPALEGSAYNLITGPVRRTRIITTIRDVVHDGAANLDDWLSALSELDMVAALGRAVR
jgi:hypothetical protein